MAGLRIPSWLPLDSAYRSQKTTAATSQTPVVNAEHQIWEEPPAEFRHEVITEGTFLKQGNNCMMIASETLDHPLLSFLFVTVVLPTHYITMINAASGTCPRLLFLLKAENLLLLQFALLSFLADSSLKSSSSDNSRKHRLIHNCSSRLQESTAIFSHAFRLLPRRRLGGCIFGFRNGQGFHRRIRESHPDCCDLASSLTPIQKVLRDSIEEAELMTKAQSIEAFAYASPDKNRLVGTPGLEDSMQYIWDILDDLDYYDLSRQWFDFDFGGEKIKTSVQGSRSHALIRIVDKSAGTTSSLKPREATQTMYSI